MRLAMVAERSSAPKAISLDESIGGERKRVKDIWASFLVDAGFVVLWRARKGKRMLEMESEAAEEETRELEGEMEN